jgi:putative membrane protein
MASASGNNLQVIAVLTTAEMLIATATGSSISLILLLVVVVWFQFSEYLPIRASEFMNDIVAPKGVVAVLVTLVVVAIAAGVVVGALRLNRFTLVRDGDVLRSSRGLLGKQAATIAISRIQAVRIVEGFSRMLLGYCSLQVEVAGIGRANVNQRMLFPLARTDRAESLIRRALPELPWPSQPLRALPARVRRRGITMEAPTEPQHGHRVSRWCTFDRVVEFTVEGQGGCGRVQDAVLLWAGRWHPIHG